MQKSSFCAFDYSKVASGSSQAAGVEASYKLFSFGANNSATSQQIQEKQSSVCTDGFGSEKYSSKASNFAKNVYQGSLDSWNRCQALAQQGVNFDLQVDQSMQGATVTLSTTSSGSTVNFNGLDQIGLGRSICTTTRNSNTGSSTGKVLTVDKTTSLKFNSASKLTITCERQMSSDGKGGLFADAQTLVFNTSAGSYQVPMVTIGLSPRVTVEQAVADLQSSINFQIQKIKSDVSTEITNAVDNVNTTLQNQKRICTGRSATASSWAKYSSGDGSKYVDIDTSKCGFTKTPNYFTSVSSLDAGNGMWYSLGSAGIYRPTNKGFAVYLSSKFTNIPDDWFINWIAIEQ